MTQNTETVPAEGAKKKRTRLHADISAKTLAALAPMIKEVQEMADGDFAFMNQMPTERFGTYVIPAERGVLVVVCDLYRLLAVHEPEGMADAPMKLYFPEAMLDAARPKMTSLRNEDGCWFEVESEPAPGRVMLLDILGMITVRRDEEKDEDEDKWGGVIGSWENGDHPGYIDGASYRAEPADPSFLAKMARKSEVKSADYNPHLLATIFEAAKALGEIVRLDYGEGGGLLEVTGDRLCGYLMPCVRDEPASSFARDALLTLGAPQPAAA